MKGMIKIYEVDVMSVWEWEGIQALSWGVTPLITRKAEVTASIVIFLEDMLVTTSTTTTLYPQSCGSWLHDGENLGPW